MKKTYIITLVLIVVSFVAGIMYAVNTYVVSMNAVKINDDTLPITPNDFKNISYIIDGREVALKDGKSEVETAPGSASKTTTQYFGNDLVVDLDNDGRKDAVFILTQNTGGSGTFFYVVVALNKENGYVGSDGYFLGDRIAPQTIEVDQNPQRKNVIVVNYADRASLDPMTARPSLGKSAYLKLDSTNMRWGIVEPAFTGEADSSRMSLGMKTWTWISVNYNDGRVLRPISTKAFTLAFGANGKFTATTDCNGVGGNYTTDSGNISFSNMQSTLMYCEGSQESDFISLIENTQRYHFTSKGELIFDLKFDSGSAVFK